VQPASLPSHLIFRGLLQAVFLAHRLSYIAYPSPELDHYVHEINLFAKFPDVVAPHMPAEWNQEAQLRYVDRARRMWGT
jgi:hypothetical protein